MKDFFRIMVFDKQGRIRQQQEGEGRAALRPSSPYEPGDVIRIESRRIPCPLKVSLSPALPEAEVWLEDHAMEFPVPFGEETQAYPAEAFGEERGIWVEAVSSQRWEAYRNLSENPLDRRGETSVYPHCTASVETRGESVFAARNTIDGRCENTFHGEWPYTSWGDNEDPEAEIRIDFGRRVLADRAEILIRADFPHDNYWKEATLEFSDGSAVRLFMEKTGNWQSFPFIPRTISWVTLKELKKSVGESPFPALTQWRIFGKDCEKE